MTKTGNVAGRGKSAKSGGARPGRLLRPPNWTADALQGIVFWIGHRRSLYRHHELSEGAITAELGNLINSHLDSKEYLYYEVGYRHLMPTDQSVPAIQNGRVDLLVAAVPASPKKDQTDDFRRSVLQAIEVKRYGAVKSEIDEDLRRLAKLKEVRPATRAFLIVVAENRFPKKFVKRSSGGGVVDVKAMPARSPIDETDCYFKVRCVYKAAHSFKNVHSAHYAVLIEVFLNPSSRVG